MAARNTHSFPAFCLSLIASKAGSFLSLEKRQYALQARPISSNMPILRGSCIWVISLLVAYITSERHTSWRRLESQFMLISG